MGFIFTPLSKFLNPKGPKNSISHLHWLINFEISQTKVSNLCFEFREINDSDLIVLILEVFSFKIFKVRSSLGQNFILIPWDFKTKIWCSVFAITELFSNV